MPRWLIPLVAAAGVSFQTAAPERRIDVLLCRPQADGVSLSLVAYEPLRVVVAWRADGGAERRAGPLDLAPEQPRLVTCDGLAPGARGHFAVRADDGAELLVGRFVTQRPPGEAFRFTITADSHLDEQTSLALVDQTMRNAAADEPDFHIDLGDTFMTEKHPGAFRAARAQYLAQRYHFGLLAGGAPLFLALGNHDGELGWLVDGNPEGMVAWSANQRRAWFPNPEPGGIYTGNERPEPGLGLLQNYYAWEWGDALLVVLDPFWPTRTRPNRRDNGWTRTLGEAQYQWLRTVLEASNRPLKFIFIHHLVPGLDQNARGGIEAVPFGEWGGRGFDGQEAFAAHRPGWPEPVHALLVRTGVTAVFHGHDHFYAHQELDGVGYQLVPQPGHPGRNTAGPAAGYGYLAGDIVSGSGHLRVSVHAGGATVDLVRAALPARRRGDPANAEILRSYRLAPRPPSRSARG